MKYLLLIIIMVSGQAFSSEDNKELECQTYYVTNGGGAISCVSKASIARDKAELKRAELEQKLLALQIKKAQKEWDHSVSFEEKVDTLQKKIKNLIPEKKKTELKETSENTEN